MTGTDVTDVNVSNAAIYLLQVFRHWSPPAHLPDTSDAPPHFWSSAFAHFLQHPHSSSVYWPLSQQAGGDGHWIMKIIQIEDIRTFPLLLTSCWSLSCLVSLHKSFSNRENVSIYGIFVPSQLLAAARNGILEFNGFVPNASSAASGCKNCINTALAVSA